jgi:hypothetical protein
MTRRLVALALSLRSFWFPTLGTRSATNRLIDLSPRRQGPHDEGPSRCPVAPSYSRNQDDVSLCHQDASFTWIHDSTSPRRTCPGSDRARLPSRTAPCPHISKCPRLPFSHARPSAGRPSTGLSTSPYRHPALSTRLLVTPFPRKQTRTTTKPFVAFGIWHLGDSRRRPRLGGLSQLIHPSIHKVP